MMTGVVWHASAAARVRHLGRMTIENATKS